MDWLRQPEECGGIVEVQIDVGGFHRKQAHHSGVVLRRHLECERVKHLPHLPGYRMLFHTKSNFKHTDKEWVTDLFLDWSGRRSGRLWMTGSPSE